MFDCGSQYVPTCVGPNSTLTLELLGTAGTARNVVARKVFGCGGGTIGRLPTNDWVLPDPLVSGRHARIRHEQGVFLIEDTSTNGVFINSLDNPLPRGVPHALSPGDCIVIDPYRISVSIGAGDRAVDPFMTARVASPVLRSPIGTVIPPLDSEAPDELDPLHLLDLVPSPGKSSPLPAAGRHAADLAAQSPLAAHYEPPAVRLEADKSPAAAAVIPDGYDPLRGDSAIVGEPIGQRPRPSVPSTATPRRTTERQRSAGETPGGVIPPAPSEAAQSQTSAAAAPSGQVPTISALLEAIGLSHVPADADLVQTLASMLRIAVGGVMDLLQARQRIKDELRMHMTTFAPRENNPLKFSADVADALDNLLVRRNPAFLPPAAAIEDAFNDLRDHQVAMLAGMRTAFDSMLSEFDPDHLQGEFDRALRTAALIPAPARLRYWDLYRERVRQHTEDPDAGFRQLFGDEFARAYDSQLAQLKTRRRSHEGVMP
jgi:type VI secretion system FHA domain protein